MSNSNLSPDATNQDLLDELDEILNDCVSAGIDYTNGRRRETDTTVKEAKQQIVSWHERVTREQIEGVIPIKHKREIDLEEGYCVTCGQIVEEDSNCVCTGYNQCIDDIKARLKELK